MDESVSIIEEKAKIVGTKLNDVVPLQCTTMATEEITHNDYYKTLICSSGAGSVSSLSLNDTIRTTLTVPAEAAAVTEQQQQQQQQQQHQQQNTSNTDSTEEEKMIPNVFVNANVVNKLNANNAQNNNNGNNHSLLMKTKRRRRKSSKQKTNSKPYKKSNWNFQKRARNGSSRLVPYNTNQFLMEEHMPEIDADCSGRCRDSSFSFDSDNDKEEYLSKEFCNVYENARSDRLYEMTKSQLIQEYLQLEASYDKLSNSLGKVTDQLDSSNGGNVLKRLTDRVSDLSAENLELRRQMADIRSRDSRHHHHHHHHHHGSHNKTSHTFNNRSITSNVTNNHNNVASSEDSESDSNSSSSSSSSNSSSSSDSSSNSNSSSNQSKSSQMSGISDNADECSQLLIKNECGDTVADDESVNTTTTLNQIIST